MKCRKTPPVTVVILYRTTKNLAQIANNPLEWEWRWRLRDRRSDKIIGASSEGYKRRIDAIANLKRVTRLPVPKLKNREDYHTWNIPR